MLPMDAKSVADEVRAAERHAALHHAPIRKMVAQYSGGKWYRDDLSCEPTPENHVFAYVDWMEPQLAYAAPAALVEPNWEKSHGEIANWMEECQARATECYPITDDFRMFVRDVLFGYGVLKIGVDSSGGSPQPFLMHVPLGQWGCATGPGIEHVKDSPLQYHRYDVDLDDVAAMRDVDPAALEKLTNTYDPAGDKLGVGVPGTRTGERKRARVYDVWFPKERTIGTLLSTGDADPMDVWLRQPKPWSGPDCGPFIVAGLKTVPGDPFPMSPLMAVMQQIEKMNAHLRADATEADSMKTIWGVDASLPEAGKAIEEASANGIVLIPGLRTGVVQKLDIGGVHPHRLEHTDKMLERVERFLAMGDVVQGISNSDTATANDRAFKSANIRVEYARSLVNNAAAVALKGQMWYRFHDPAYEERITVTRQVMDPMTGQAAPQQAEAFYRGGLEGGWYRGEFFPPQEDIDWEKDFTVTIDPESTSHTDDQQKLQDAMTLLQVQQTAWQMMQTMPGTDVEWTVNLIGEAMNRRKLFKNLFTPQLVAMAQAGNPMMPIQVPQGASPAMGPGLTKGVGPGQTVLPPRDPMAQGMAGGLAAGPQLGARFGGGGKPGGSPASPRSGQAASPPAFGA